MTIGSVLLQPQTLARFETFDYKNSLADDALALAQQLLMHPEWVESIMNEVGDELEDFALSFVADLTTRTDQGIQALESFVQPFIEELQNFAGENPRFETFADILQLVNAIVERIAELLEALTLDNIRNFITQFFTIIFNRFGLTVDFLQELIGQVVDVVINVLATVPAAASKEFIAVRQQLRRLLMRVKREILSNLPDLDLNAERIARVILKSLRDNGVDVFREKAACVVSKISAAFDAATSLTEIVDVIFGRDTVGAARVPSISKGKTYCWYASWLYSVQRRDFGGKALDFLIPFYTTDEVWISEDGKKLILRRVNENFDEVLYESDSEINWWDAPQFNGTGDEENFSFNFRDNLSPQFLEEWTKATSIIVYVWKMFSNFTAGAVEPGNHVSHMLQMGWNFTRTVGTLSTNAPFTSWLRDEMNWGVGKRTWIDMFFQWSSVVFGSIEGRHSETNVGNQFLVWFTLLGDDALDSFFLHEVAIVIHEGFLSIFTLLNNTHTGYIEWDDEGHPENRNFVYPLVNLSVIFWGYILNKHIIPIKEYSHPFEPNNAADYHKWWWGVSPAFGALAGVTGELIGDAFSRSFSFKTLLIQLGAGAFKGWGTHVVQNYYWKEGDTNDGKYNQARTAPGVEFNGYPDAETSPYYLPVPAGKNTFVGQANQGMFSHFYGFGINILPQVYAFDFSHDLGDPVVAMRSGTVVDYFDWVPDDINPSDAQSTAAAADAVASGFTQAGQSGTPTANTNGDREPGWNFILIRHDDPFNEESADEKAHDVGEAGAAGRTYAVYGHGKKDGVRNAFNNRTPSVAENAIIGTQVRRGETIMEAGDTGVSFHNHLHVHVLIDPATSLATGTPPTEPTIVNDSELAFFSIPFVFKDAKHPFKQDGRLFNLTWYKSKNEAPS